MSFPINPDAQLLDFLLSSIAVATLASIAGWLIARRLAGRAALRRLVLQSALLCCVIAPLLVGVFSATGVTLASIPLFCGSQGTTTPRAALEIDRALSPPRLSLDAVPVDRLPPAKESHRVADFSVGCFVCPEQKIVATSPPPPAMPTLSALPPAMPSQSDAPPARGMSRRKVVATAIIVWAGGTLLLLTRLVRNCLQVVLLRRSSRAVNESRAQRIWAEVLRRFESRRPPLLLASRRAMAPLAVGFGRPAVVLPLRFLAEVNDDELRDVFAHEMAHLRRGDERLVLLEELAAAAYWPIVSVHALIRELRRAREEVCDNEVLALSDPIRYGKTLLRVAELIVQAPSFRTTVGMLGRRGKLERRIAGLFDSRRRTMVATGRTTACVVTGLFLAGGALIAATRFAATAGAQGAVPAASVESPLESAATGEAAGAEQSQDAAAVQELIRELKGKQLLERAAGAYDHFSSIGGLAEGRYWQNKLPLDADQAAVLSRFDDLLWDARHNGWETDARYLGSQPADYREHMTRSKTREDDTLDHASAMVLLGLLTPAQSALVTQRNLSSPANVVSALRHRPYVQELVGLTKDQKRMLEETRQGYSALQNILTPEQQEILSRLRAVRTLPAEPPELPALTPAEAARIDLEERSTAFRALAIKADAVKLSPEQLKLVEDLKEITRLGLYWISLSAPADNIAETQAKFLEHAEQVLKLGILTHVQAMCLMLCC